MSVATRLWLVRHGQSIWNATGRVQGQSGEGLSALGHRQAAAAATWLSATLDDGRVISSDLSRAHETATPIAAALGVDVQLDADVRERCFGSWEGHTPQELAAREDGLWTEWTSVVMPAAGDNDLVTKVGGESDQVMNGRVLRALRRHGADAARDGVHDVVIVTHGGTIWHGLHGLLTLPPLTLGGLGNASISTVQFTGDHVWLDLYNSQAHLATADQTTFRPREFGDQD